jgi:hypothetical protein
LTDSQLCDSDVHNPRPVELRHSIAKHLAHTPDLAVSSLGENNAKLIASHSSHSARLRLTPKYDHASRHLIEKCLVKSAINLYEIFPFMTEFGTENFVDDIAVIRQQDETG